MLDEWQEYDIIRPIFGEVVWSPEWDRYVRRYRIAYIVLGRKNGKSEIIAGIVLYLLLADGEMGAEVYGAAKDTKQAGKVGDVVVRMMQLSPVLGKRQKAPLGDRLSFNKNSRRITDEPTASYFEVITSDEKGELGSNPHGSYIDEVLSQADGGLFDTLRTSMGTRTQPLFVLATTETDDEVSFGATAIDEAERIEEQPARAPHIFAYVRKMPRTPEELAALRRCHRGHPRLPVSLDPFDERNWAWPNPALGSFLSVQSLRDEALEAKNEPAKENSFRQYRCNQRVQQTTRWLPLHLWDACAGEIATSPNWMLPKLRGRQCIGGLDLAARIDLTSWCLIFPGDDDVLDVLWRYWLPEEMAPKLDEYTGGQVSEWAKAGWITLTEGNVVDYERVYDDIEVDAARFKIAMAGYDPWSTEPVVQEIHKRTGIEMISVAQTYAGHTAPLTDVMARAMNRKLRHFANPVSRWHADSLEVRRARDNADQIRAVKPVRDRAGKRIDGMSALLDALHVHLLTVEEEAPAAADTANTAAAGGEDMFRAKGRLDLGGGPRGGSRR